MTILVTGGAGYIGSHLIESLKSDEVVIILDNYPSSHYRHFSPQTIYIQGDIRNAKTLRKIFKKYDIGTVYHLAALKSVTDSIQNPKIFRDINISGTQSLLEALPKNVIFIFASSASVYGNSQSKTILSEQDSTHPLSPYGEVKLVGEKLVSDWNGKSAALRLFNVAGKSKNLAVSFNNQTVLPKYAKLLKNDQSLAVWGKTFETHDGTAVRDYVHVFDVVQAMKTSAEYLVQQKLPTAKKWNVCTSVGTSMNELICEFVTASGKTPKIEYLSPMPGEIDFSVGDYSLISKETGWKPRFGISEIVKSEWESSA